MVFQCLFLMTPWLMVQEVLKGFMGGVGIMELIFGLIQQKKCLVYLCLDTDKMYQILIFKKNLEELFTILKKTRFTTLGASTPVSIISTETAI